MGFSNDSVVKNQPAMQETWIWSLMSPGGGNSNLLQYSCMKNPMDRGAWWATVRRVAASRTWLSDWAHTHTNESNKPFPIFSPHPLSSSLHFPFCLPMYPEYPQFNKLDYRSCITTQITPASSPDHQWDIRSSLRLRFLFTFTSLLLKLVLRRSWARFEPPSSGALGLALSSSSPGTFGFSASFNSRVPGAHSPSDPMSPGATPSLSCFLSISPLSPISSEQSPSQNFQFLVLELPFLWSWP